MSNQPSERENPYEPAEPPGTDQAGRPAEPDSPYEEPTAVQPAVNDEPAEDTAAYDPAPPEDAAAYDPAPPEDTAAYDPAPPEDTAAYDAAPAYDAVPADPAPSEPGPEPRWDEQDTRPVPAEGPEPGRDVDPDSTVTSTFDIREAGESGVHEAERPVPRSGLAEHHSAGYLTGERRPVEEAAPTTQVPVAADETPTTTDDDARDESSGAWIGGAGAAATTSSTPAAEPTGRSRRDVVLDGTTAVTRPPSRAGAHVLTILVTLLLTPVAWYLLADAGARLTLPARNPWDTGNLNIAALLELAGGLLVLAVVLLAARWSSVGAIVTGILVVVLGVPFLAAPTWTQEILEPVVTWLDRFGDFGGNVAHHLVASGATGRLVITGLTLVLVGVVSHGARRKGRREVTRVVETA
ncbi:hypothetical protein FHE66_09655 [Georgenia sp. 311]|uniref:hypothetical protein n=1 Tax=Georgenia sp. 311 TaxID=2585134 RepID=UPI001111CE76|nr:hypothetical protein [Georgenia sp. 311]TNC17546.1 hypothetical protein FHE66_09655 [Georgenia sp. 311]